MSLLEDVSNLKSQGYTDNQIFGAMTERGISPRDIKNALSQSEIKSAVGSYTPQTPQSMGTQKTTQALYTPQTREIDSFQPQQYNPPPQNFQNYAQDYSQDQYSQQEPVQDYYSPQENYNYSPQENSYGEEYYQTDTIIDISEQVFAEKISPIIDKINSFNEFKIITQTKIEDMEKRLNYIEQIINSLQLSILNKVGSYGENLDSIKKEMGMMQNSFSKVINPLTDELSKIASSKRKK